MAIEFMKKVGSMYLECNSVKDTADSCGISEVKARRILITLGLWKSPASERVMECYKRGLSSIEIASELSLSVKAVEAYLPYRKGMYGLDDKSADAIRSELYRKRKNVAQKNMVQPKEDMGMKSYEELRQAYNNKIKQQFKEEDYKKLLFTKDEFSQMKILQPKKLPEVFHLKCELSESDTMNEEEKKLAKVEDSISRDVLVPASMNLHAMHYMIQRLFGWQNSHLHHFSLTKKDFNQCVQGRYGTYSDLTGILFRYPDEDNEDLFWDDDYDESYSVKSWLQSKYYGPYFNLAISDCWVGAQLREQEFLLRNPQISDDDYLIDIDFISFSKDHLMESLTVGELFSKDKIDIRQWKADALIKKEKMYKEWNEIEEYSDLINTLCQYKAQYNELYITSRFEKEEAEKFAKKQGKTVQELLDGYMNIILYLQKRVAAECEDYHINLIPRFNELVYTYDYGDGWEVKITLVDEIYSELEDEQSQYVYKKNFPLCIDADGLNVMDDCGNVSGFLETLKIIYGKDKEEAKSMRNWASMQGWTGRRSKPKNIL